MIYKIKSGGSSKNWIQKAVNPKHKGYCTPMTKSTCTPKRKALARTFKKMAKKRKHENGGSIDFLLPLIEKFKSGGEVQYKNGLKNSFYRKPKYQKAKCGKKLIKKKQQGGYIQKSIEQDKRNKDYLNNPLNFERIGKNIKNLVSMFKLPAIAALSTTAAIPGLSMMGYGTASNIVAGGAAGSAAILAPLMGNAFLHRSEVYNANNSTPKDSKVNKWAEPSDVYSWLNSIKHEKSKN